jgi:uncharacterized protein (TIGR03067 family)
MRSAFAAFALVTALVAGTAAQGTAQPPVPKDFAPFQGTWLITHVSGQALSDQGVEMTLTFTGDKYAQSINGAVNERGTVKLDASKKPMTFDLIITEGDDAGKTQLGVVELTGDTIKGKLSLPGETFRPTDFDPQDGAIAFAGTRKK